MLREPLEMSPTLVAVGPTLLSNDSFSNSQAPMSLFRTLRYQERA